MLRKALFGGLLACLSIPSLAGDQVVVFEADDPAMSKAVAEARATLNEILEIIPIEDGQYSEALTLKVAFEAVDTEYTPELIWVGTITPLDHGSFQGMLQNEPNGLPGKTVGSLVTFELPQVNDWSLITGGKLYGNFTTRVMLPHISPKDAEFLRGVLSEHPLP